MCRRLRGAAAEVERVVSVVADAPVVGCEAALAAMVSLPTSSRESRDVVFWFLSP